MVCGDSGLLCRVNTSFGARTTGVEVRGVSRGSTERRLPLGSSSKWFGWRGSVIAGAFGMDHRVAVVNAATTTALPADHGTVLPSTGTSVRRSWPVGHSE